MGGDPPVADDDQAYMALALDQARRALDAGEVPIGAVIVAAGTVVARAHNQSVRLRDPTAHAEMIAITQAAAALENDRLTEATLFVTIEPCAMCAGAAVWARLRRVVFGAQDPKAGAAGSVLDVLRCGALTHHPAVTEGVRAEESAALLRGFFERRRASASGGPGGPGERGERDDGHERHER